MPANVEKKTSKWILVTGASTGIGRATAEQLASNGFKVYAGARKQADLDALQEMDNITAVKLDVTKKEDVESVLKQVAKSNEGLFGLVNNAGIAIAGPLMDMPDEDIYQQIEVNVMGVHRVTRAFFPLLLESKGRIVMMSSNSGFWAAPFFGPYNLSKFALEGYSDTLRRELLLYDVKVIIIQPGSIHTEIWEKGRALVEKFRGSIFEKEAEQIGEYAIRKGTTEGLSPVLVAKAVYEALTKDKPKLRYLIAPDMFRNKMLKILPGRKIDNIILKKLKQYRES
ncbi:MAG: SDR family oxidoreductase [Candidatus Hodarchaeota archaeon]